MSTQITIPPITSGCIPGLNFKVGSVGPKVSFYKTPTTPIDVIIPGQLEITRDNSGGIYNIAAESNFQIDSPKFTTWNTQYVNPENTNWASLIDISNRTYVSWKNAVLLPDGNYAPPQYVGIRSILKFDDGFGTVIYYLIIFTEWEVGGGGGFGYDRYEIYSDVAFVRPNYSEETVDELSPGVHIGRRDSGGQIYNVLVESGATTGVSPEKTKWNSIYTDSRDGYSGFTDLTNLEDRVYTDFANALDYAVGNNVLNTDLILHDTTTNLYYKVVFDTWQSGGNGGGFTYTRTVIPQSCGIKFADGTVLNSAGSIGTVQSVTGLNTDNTDPVNPVVQISVDGTTITGAGTPASPLVAVTACKQEFTKIVAHSLYLDADMDPNSLRLFYGDKSTVPAGWAIWSGSQYEVVNSILAPLVKTTDVSLGIPLPINLVANDVVTLSGTAYFRNIQDWQIANYTSNLTLGVFYFDASDISENIPAYTFVPVQTFTFERENGTLTFATEVTLGSNYDIHTTRFIVGFNVFATCNDLDTCTPPEVANNYVTVSYTFDIQRPCAAGIDNFIIKNCCEPIITELVHIPGLTVGDFHVDDEGNCWEVIAESTDVTNFTRNFVDTYTSCVECQTANPCPQNLSISSCCVEGKEFVTGSLPGLNVGDTFVDNHGLCWFVDTETGAPISEESITVDTEIVGGCIDCTDLNPCPTFWEVYSCCLSKKIREIIATSVPLNPGDSFVDTNGMCWTVGRQALTLPTNYGIVVDTVYSVTPGTNCSLCITANPCPTEYFITVRACCDPDRVEVIAVPAANMVFTEGLVFKDQYGICWEVMSYNTTGTETYPLTWVDNKIGIYPSCAECNKTGICLDCVVKTPEFNTLGGPQFTECPTLWKVKDCQTNDIYTAQAFGVLTVGSFYPGFWSDGMFGMESCYEVLGYGYPDTDPLMVKIFPGKPESATCADCLLTLDTSKNLELQSCCGGGTINVNYQGGWYTGIGGTQSVNVFDEFSNYLYTACFTLVGFSTVPVDPGSANTDSSYTDCNQCLIDYPCA